MVNVKKKGNFGENRFSNWLNDQGIRAWKDGMSGGGTREKSDIGNNINAHFEVKTVKNLSLRKAWSQAVRDASKTQNTPHLIVHLDGMPKDNWFVIMNNWDWIELLKSSLEENPIQEDIRLKYPLMKLKDNIREVLAKLEKL